MYKKCFWYKLLNDEFNNYKKSQKSSNIIFHWVNNKKLYNKKT